jgi:hypothetical protein
VLSELQSLTPAAECERRRPGKQAAALARECFELEWTGLLLGLEADDAVAAKRRAEQEALAHTTTSAEDDERGRSCGELSELLDLAFSIDQLYCHP